MEDLDKEDHRLQMCRGSHVAIACEYSGEEVDSADDHLPELDAALKPSPRSKDIVHDHLECVGQGDAPWT